MENSDSIAKLLDQLRPFVDSARKTKVSPNRIFSACLRASFSKAFDFIEHVYQQNSDDIAFFQVATLRSICEDIICLSFVKSLPENDRELTIRCLMLLEVNSKIEQQNRFFELFRPLQPVLNKGIPPAELKNIEEDIRKIWMSHGWSKIKLGRNPTTRDLAEKVDPGMLLVVYDYLFRLTSSLVHFSPQVLLRTGWGETKTDMSFSIKKMNPYFEAVSKVYGVLLFSLYFEYFAKFLKPGSTNQDIVAELRYALVMQSRWPEMVTFEEMNQALPDTNPFEILGRVMMAEKTKAGFMAAVKD